MKLGVKHYSNYSIGFFFYKEIKPLLFYYSLYHLYCFYIYLYQEKEFLVFWQKYLKVQNSSLYHHDDHFTWFQLAYFYGPYLPCKVRTACTLKSASSNLYICICMTLRSTSNRNSHFTYIHTYTHTNISPCMCL